MNLFQELETLINVDFGSEPNLKSACLNIFNYIVKSQTNDLMHISFANISKISNKNLETEEILKIANYFVGDRVHLLEEAFEFIDDNEDSFDVNKKSLREALDSGSFLHPDTLEPVSDFPSKVFIYFTVSSLAKELNKNFK